MKKMKSRMKGGSVIFCCEKTESETPTGGDDLKRIDISTYIVILKY